MDGEKIHEIGSIDSIVDAEDSVRAGLPPALDAAIFNVVDDQAGAVQELDEPAYLDGFFLRLVIEELVDEQRCIFAFLPAITRTFLPPKSHRYS